MSLFDHCRRARHWNRNDQWRGVGLDLVWNYLTDYGVVMGLRRKVYKKIMQSLKENPEDWSIGKYYATNHKLNVSVWLANRYYCTHFTVGEMSFETMSIMWPLFPWEWWRYRLIKQVEQTQFEKVFTK